MLTRDFVDILCLNHEIVPISNTIKNNVNKILSPLPKEEAKKMRRKFRKLWRKAADKFHPKGKEFKTYSNGNEKPKIYQFKNRKLIVTKLLIEESDKFLQRR